MANVVLPAPFGPAMMTTFLSVLSVKIGLLLPNHMKNRN